MSEKFQAVCCIRNIFSNSMIIMDNSVGTIDKPHHYKCMCDGVDKIILVTMSRVVKLEEMQFVFMIVFFM